MNALVTLPGGWELVLIVLVIVLFFGAAKLPELARGSGRALRIFKAETKGLSDDDETAAPEQKKLGPGEQKPDTTSDDSILREPHDGTS